MLRLLDGLRSLKLTVACLVLSMILVVLGTLAQVHVGIFEAQKRFFSSFFVYWKAGEDISVPVLPGGALLGALLLMNLLVRYLLDFSDYGRRPGLMLTHVGLIVLLLGGYVATFSSVESQMYLDEGQTVRYSVSSREAELVLIDVTDPEHDRVVSVPQSRLSSGGIIEDERLPFRLKVAHYFPNAELVPRREGATPVPATTGVGLSMTASPLPLASRDDLVDNATAFVEILDGPRSLGVWLLSSGLEEPQFFSHEGRTYGVALRRCRYYFPFTLTLKDFRHDKHPGTDIPRNFSSLVRLTPDVGQEARDVLIYMNHPLRHEGKTFYQSGFGKNDAMSILQVVENPGWLLPYVSCSLIAVGLLVHFMHHLLVFSTKRKG
jgi:hypothetical protein